LSSSVVHELMSEGRECYVWRLTGQADQSERTNLFGRSRCGAHPEDTECVGVGGVRVVLESQRQLVLQTGDAPWLRRNGSLMEKQRRGWVMSRRPSYRLRHGCSCVGLYQAVSRSGDLSLTPRTAATPATCLVDCLRQFALFDLVVEPPRVRDTGRIEHDGARVSLSSLRRAVLHMRAMTARSGLSSTVPGIRGG